LANASTGRRPRYGPDGIEELGVSNPIVVLLGTLTRLLKTLAMATAPDRLRQIRALAVALDTRSGGRTAPHGWNDAKCEGEQAAPRAVRLIVEAIRSNHPEMGGTNRAAVAELDARLAIAQNRVATSLTYAARALVHATVVLVIVTVLAD